MKHLLLIPTTLISTASATETRLSKSSEARVPESVVDGAENFYRSDKVDRAEGHVPQPIEHEFYDFYRTPRGEVTPEGSSPKLTTHPTLTSNVKFMQFYPFNDIETISPRHILFISGDKAHSREFSEDAYKRAAEPKELYVVPNAGHVDLYDRVNPIPRDKLHSFFDQHLGEVRAAK
jgi:uncharacterized protein